MPRVNGQFLDFEAQIALIASVVQDLEAGGLVRPLDQADAQAVRLWRDMELCSMLQPCFGETPDPRTLTAQQRRASLQRLGKEFYVGRFQYEIPCWLLHEGQPAGTLSVSQIIRGPNLVSVENLYVQPSHRGRGLCTQALRACHAAALRAGLGGLRLETYWVWHQAVRYYLSRQFWVFHWKHDLALLCHKALPDYQMAIGADAARFSVRREPGGPFDLLYRASRQGDRLVLEGGDGPEWIACRGLATLSVGLALSGWPLVRSPQHYAEHCHDEEGPPEALAYRIEWYEALAHKAGWRVETPRIPGQSYRTYAELRSADTEDEPAELAVTEK